jgi:hypothetical protein
LGSCASGHRPNHDKNKDGQTIPYTLIPRKFLHNL